MARASYCHARSDANERREEGDFDLNYQPLTNSPSLDSIQWLRKIDEPRKHDLGLSRIEVNGEWFEKMEMRSGDYSHYPAIHTFQKRKCELISKVLFESVIINFKSCVLSYTFHMQRQSKQASTCAMASPRFIRVITCS